MATFLRGFALNMEMAAILCLVTVLTLALEVAKAPCGEIPSVRAGLASESHDHITSPSL